MIEIIPSHKRHFNDFGWLMTYWLFSFSDYYDPVNLQHGALRVFNDDVVQAHNGFPRHPHEEMEILSFVLDGEMTHKDSMGHDITIRTNDVQRMTAGTGIQHSEVNLSDAPVHFYQIWIYPDKRGLTPSYEQKNFSPETWRNRLALLASDRAEEGIVHLNTDASIYRAALTHGNAVQYATDSGRKLFVYAMDGAITVNGKVLEKGGQARIDAENELEIAAKDTGEFLLIDVPAAAH